MPSLKDIAKQIGGLTVANAPIRTGRLRRALATANTPDKVLKQNPKTKSFSFEVDYAPDKAFYGKFVEEGYTHVGGKEIPPNPFAEKALYSPIVDSMLNDYMDEIGKMVVEQISKAVDDL